ncbi:hypothetical protein MRB53_020744 [Persea americana]|uniref:Uncharacterized protein n=1 Tax=Persea americana TaxID=3435 RepID=A0ACC2L2Y3_PERAE|nr:hypothetical protein MRB53_020744 [Persea americana]
MDVRKRNSTTIARSSAIGWLIVIDALGVVMLMRLRDLGIPHVLNNLLIALVPVERLLHVAPARDHRPDQVNRGSGQHAAACAEEEGEDNAEDVLGELAEGARGEGPNEGNWAGDLGFARWVIGDLGEAGVVDGGGDLGEIGAFDEESGGWVEGFWVEIVELAVEDEEGRLVSEGGV